MLYSYALDAEGRRQNISNLDAPKPFQCGDCDGEMVARRGNVNAWHYAHKSQVVCEPSPDPDNALHRFAQDIIFENFNRHRDKGTEYKVGVKCAGFSAGLDYLGASGCENPVARNAAEPDAQIFKEHILVPNTRSDLVIQMPDDKALILEVVNTHAPEESTRARYIEAEYPVFIKKVSWDSLGGLHIGLIADEVINVPKVRCASCKNEKRRVEEELALRHEALQRRMRVIDDAVQKVARRQSPTPRFSPWYQVYKPKWGTNRPVQMYPNTQRMVFANAIILTELGFVQHNPTKPHLFSYLINPRPRVVLYADFGGSDVVPIYEDTSAMLYAPDFEDNPELEQYAIDRFGKMLQREGVNVRTGFESSAYLKQVDVNPVKHVPKAILDGLMRWGNSGTTQNRPTTQIQDDDYDDLYDLMTDYPGKPVKSPKSWIQWNE